MERGLLPLSREGKRVLGLTGMWVRTPVVWNREVDLEGTQESQPVNVLLVGC